MKIGLTYDLRSEYLSTGYDEEQTAEFDREETITAVEDALQMLGYETDRIGHAKQLVSALIEGKRWDLVFNIAEGLHGIGREAQVPVLLDLYEIPYTFSDPLVMSLTLHKAMTKRVVRDAGVATADFVTVAAAEDAETISLEPPYFVKPLAEGTGKGISADSIVHERAALPPACRRVIEAYGQPALVESYLTGREFTVGMLGTGGEDARVLGTIEVCLSERAEPGAYSYQNKEHWEERVAYHLVLPERENLIGSVEGIALQAWNVLGCRDAGRVDVRCDRKGRPFFMEVNPLAGIHPHHSDLPIICNHLNIPYVTLIERIVASAKKRMRKRKN